MKTLLLLLATLLPAVAEISIPVSIKVILGPNGEWPSNNNREINLNSPKAIRANIDWTNAMLAKAGEPYRLVLRANLFNPEGIYTIANQSQWFNVPARDSRAEVEGAVLASPETYFFHDDAVNVYINNTTSGQCSIPPDGIIITMGAGAYNELLIHEIGHFFGLFHTHSASDSDGDIDDWGDGDFLSDTLDDDPDANGNDINLRYPNESEQMRFDLIFNVMSYHNTVDGGNDVDDLINQNLDPDNPTGDLNRLTWLQREKFIRFANKDITRLNIANGKGIFLSDDGVDGANDGQIPFHRIATLQHAQDVKETDNDVILVRGIIDNASGTYTSPQVWMKWREDGILK